MDKQAAGAGLALVAMALLLIGVFTNSWWKIKRGWSWQGVGLLEQKVCVDPPGMLERCESIKHARARKMMIEMSKNWVVAKQRIQKVLDNPKLRQVANRAELQASLERLDEMLGNTETIDITVGDGSWITMGKLVYYGTFAVLILLAVAISMSRIASEHAALVDKIAAVACFALLTVAVTFVFRVPDYIKHSVPAFDAGFSRYVYWVGGAAGTGASVLLSMSMADAPPPITARLLADEASPRTDVRKPSSSYPTCPQCNARAIYREDIRCYICETCRINV